MRFVLPVPVVEQHRDDRGVRADGKESSHVEPPVAVEIAYGYGRVGARPNHHVLAGLEGAVAVA